MKRWTRTSDCTSQITSSPGESLRDNGERPGRMGRFRGSEPSTTFAFRNGKHLVCSPASITILAPMISVAALCPPFDRLSQSVFACLTRSISCRSAHRLGFGPCPPSLLLLKLSAPDIPPDWRLRFSYSFIWRIFADISLILCRK